MSMTIQRHRLLIEIAAGVFLMPMVLQGPGLGGIGNVIWFIVAEVWLAIGHVISAVLCFITILGIPFGIQHLKLAGIALAPIGKTIVPKEVADAARRINAEYEAAAPRNGR